TAWMCALAHLMPRLSGAWRAPGLLVRRMTVEGTGRSELAELVADHFLSHQHGNVLVPVMYPEGQANELRQDRRATAPGLDYVVPARRPRGLRLLEQKPVDERPFPHRARHLVLTLLLLPRMAARNDELRGLLVGPGLLALGGEP